MTMEVIMKKTVYNFIIAERYGIFYFCLQGILCILFFIPSCLSNYDMCNYFYDEMITIYEQNLSYFETLIKTMAVISAIFSGFVYKITLISGLFVISVFLFRKSKYKKIKPLLSTRFVLFWSCVGILLNMSTTVFVNLFLEIFPAAGRFNIVFSDNNPENFILSLLAIGIIAPVTEEIVFRYSIFSALKNYGRAFVIIYSSLFFAIMHINPIQIGYAFILGVLFGYLYSETENFLIPVLLHVSINSSSMIAQYYKKSDFLLLALAICALPVVIYNILPDSVKNFLLYKKRSHNETFDAEDGS